MCICTRQFSNCVHRNSPFWSDRPHPSISESRHRVLALSDLTSKQHSRARDLPLPSAPGLPLPLPSSHWSWTAAFLTWPVWMRENLPLGSLRLKYSSEPTIAHLLLIPDISKCSRVWCLDITYLESQGPWVMFRKEQLTVWPLERPACESLIHFPEGLLFLEAEARDQMRRSHAEWPHPIICLNLLSTTTTTIKTEKYSFLTLLAMGYFWHSNST